jgi:anthranilate synthase component 1
MTLESYPYVHHIVSNIKGKLRQGITIKDLVRALFPGGTITGCPKVRCMQIIAELEQMPRQAYTGSLGYVSSNGKMDFNILIRTITKQNNSLTLRAGAGIVFDSIAERELEETKHKAEGVLKIFTE